MGLSRLCRLACINTDSDKPELKIEYANYAKTTCDPDTLTRFGWPEIALNVGVICRYMAEFLSEKYPAREEDTEQYYNSAAEFFALAAGMEDKNNNNAPTLSAKALAELQDLGYGASRPAQQVNSLQPSTPQT